MWQKLKKMFGLLETQAASKTAVPTSPNVEKELSLPPLSKESESSESSIFEHWDNSLPTDDPDVDNGNSLGGNPFPPTVRF